MKKIIFAAFVAAIVSVSCNKVNNLKSISATEAYFKPSFSYVTEENGFTKNFKDYYYSFQVYDSIADGKVYHCAFISRKKAFVEYWCDLQTIKVGSLNGGMLFVKGCDTETADDTTPEATIGKKMVVRKKATPCAEKSWHKVICKMNLIDFEELVNNGSRVFEDSETGFTCTL